MKKILLFLLLVFAQNALSQNQNIEKRPTAYLLSSGDTQSALTRPRRIETAAENSKRQCKSDFLLEQRVFDLINEQRVRLGFAVLKWNDEVAEMARRHSENMAQFKFFSHTDLDGLLVNDRADTLGIGSWQAIGENIAYNRGYENPAESAVEKWMLSPSHRENLLDNRWRESGIGIAVTEDGTFYFTEVFLLRK